MDVLEIELNGCLTVKRLPKFRTTEGFVDYVEIRKYFHQLGYAVGGITVR